tara:strand:+ start:15 stop:419 length:405 start_codon:yes stop_codon:yes gene_type:complete
MKYNPKVWGPQYWFVLHTIARIYPEKPTTTMRKKYYQFIQNFPLFIPDPKMANKFIEILDAYPVSSYLDSRYSLMRWMNFIHNKVNTSNVSFQEGKRNYLKYYIPEKENHKKSYTFWVSIGSLCLVFFYALYNK